MSFPSEIEFIVGENDKGGNPKRPDYRGEVKLGGEVYEVAAWVRTKQGTSRKFISGKLKRKERPQPTEAESSDRGGFEPRRPAVTPASPSNLDEDVPF